MNPEEVREAMVGNDVAKRFRKMARCLAQFYSRGAVLDARDDYQRACGDCECPCCGLPYIDHPEHPDNGLVRLCNGKWVKL